jgi:putative exosortase-associated protein (TIGR04073 family)
MSGRRDPMRDLHRWRGLAAWLTAAVLVAGPAGPARAVIIDRGAQPLRKLSRGVANAVGGVLEIPLAISHVHQEEGPVAALSWGLFLGIGAAVTRTVVGVVETATFLFPLPRTGYEPIMQPEFLLHPEGADALPAYYPP